MAAADASGIRVTGIDLLVPDITGSEYAFIEANERPGLANHEPQPTAAAFIDYLFPGHPGQPLAWSAPWCVMKIPLLGSSRTIQCLRSVS